MVVFSFCDAKIFYNFLFVKKLHLCLQVTFSSLLQKISQLQIVFFCKKIERRSSFVHVRYYVQICTRKLIRWDFIMYRKEDKNSIIELCPIRNVVARFGNKWAFLVLLTINEKEVLRFSELCKSIPDVSSRMLSETLRTLEADGLISRKAYPVVPPKVEYRLTELGKSLIPHIMSLTEWALENMDTIMSHRKNFKKQATYVLIFRSQSVCYVFFYNFVGAFVYLVIRDKRQKLKIYICSSPINDQLLLFCIFLYEV